MIEVPVEGGVVRVRDGSEVTAAGVRGVHARVAVFGAGRFRDVVASGVTDTDDLPAVLGWSKADADRASVALQGIADAVTWALLDSWTLDVPFPESVQAFAGLPEDVRGDVEAATRVAGAGLLRAIVGG